MGGKPGSHPSVWTTEVKPGISLLLLVVSGNNVTCFHILSMWHWEAIVPNRLLQILRNKLYRGRTSTFLHKNTFLAVDTLLLLTTSFSIHSFPSFHFPQIYTSSISLFGQQQCNKKKNLSYDQASFQGRRKLTTVAPKLLEGMCWTYVCGKQKFPNLSKTPSFS